jgi:hypothetical protein
MLRVRPAGHRQVGMLKGDRPCSAQQPVQVALNRVERSTGLEDEARVDDVLRCRTPVNPDAVLTAALAKYPHHRDERVLRNSDPMAELSKVESRRVALGSDRVGSAPRDETTVCKRLDERFLGMKPPLEQGPRVEALAHLLRTKEITQ